MSDDTYSDILDEICFYHPLQGRDEYARAEYDRAVARVANTGGEEQRAQLLELIHELDTGATESEDDEE